MRTKGNTGREESKTPKSEIRKERKQNIWTKGNTGKKESKQWE